MIKRRNVSTISSDPKLKFLNRLRNKKIEFAHSFPHFINVIFFSIATRGVHNSSLHYLILVSPYKNVFLFFASLQFAFDCSVS